MGRGFKVIRNVFHWMVTLVQNSKYTTTSDGQSLTLVPIIPPIFGAYLTLVPSLFKHEFYPAGWESYLDLVFKLEAFSVVLSIQLTNKMLVVTRKE